MNDQGINDRKMQVDNAFEAEVLIGRIIDGEASQADLDRFRRLCELEPLVWRRLAQRQHDLLLLTGEFEACVGDAMRVELPETHGTAGGSPRFAAHTKTSPTRKLSLLVVFSGWAAVLILSAVWAMTIRDSHPLEAHSPVHRSLVQGSLSPQQLLEAYLLSERVIGELDPVLLETTELPDGRVRIRSIRRIEEVEYFNSMSDMPVQTLLERVEAVENSEIGEFSGRWWERPSPAKPK